MDREKARQAELSERFRTSGLTPDEVHELHRLTEQIEAHAWSELGCDPQEKA